MSQKYQSIPVVADLNTILLEWAKQYIPTDGSTKVISTEWFVDVQKNKVCFVIGTMEETK